MTTTQSRHSAYRRQRPAWAPGWPIYLMLYGYPLWWALGIDVFLWLGLTLPIVAWLWGRRNVLMPPGAGWWTLFVGWVVLSGSQLAGVDDFPSFVFRLSIYIAAGIWFVYAANLSAEGNANRIARAFLWFFAFLVFAGLFALLTPVTDFVTPFERVLPRSISSIPFVNQMIHGHVSQVHDFIGFAVARPAAPFAFTNEWGSAVGLLAPVAVFAVTRLPAGPKRVAGYALLVLALFPAIYSLNRGLWLSIAFALGYVALRALLRGRPRPFMNLVGIALVVAALFVLTPLGDLASSRLETGHSDARRTSLVEQSLDGIAEAPIVGHGGPRVNPEEPDRAPIGTHGQIWLLGYSHGIPAVVLFLLTMVAILMGTWRANEDELGFWVNAVVFVAIVQMFFYSLIPVQLQFIMILSGISLAQAREKAEPLPRWDQSRD